MENNDTSGRLTEISQELMAVANDALLYCKDKFDTERFKQVRTLAAELLSLSAEGITKQQAQELFEDCEGYQTPRIDTRAAVFNDRDEVLLVKDYDGKWTLPGGWCEYNMSIMENTIKEAREESGIKVEPFRLVAAHSNRKHNNPKSYFYVTRFFILCRYISGEYKKNEETTEARYFSVDNLPSDLNGHKSSASQIRLCLEAWHAKEWVPDID